MLRKKLIFFIACLGICSAFWAIKKASHVAPPAAPQVEPVQNPYAIGVAASGIIEAVGENLRIGSPEDGIIQKIHVAVWDEVKKGDPLFQLDGRALQSELLVAIAKEEVAAAEYAQLNDQFSRLSKVQDPRAISQEQLRSKEHEVKVALAYLLQMKREREKNALLLERLTICSPIDGRVVQKTIQVGQYLQASATNDSPPLVIGDVRQLQIRVDIDEHNASNCISPVSATAFPKNRPGYAIPLHFVRIDPYVIPKTSLTGSSSEKVDTRVLQVIYTFDPPQDVPLYIGQQMDVYIEREKK
jgi:HlyD family secretion protein